MTDRVAHADCGAIARPADFLTGDWIMTRRIRIRRSAVRGFLEGHASVRADGHQSSLNEQGLLRLDGREALASQRYTLTFRGAVVQVHFRNGSFFHEFELRTRGYTAIYHCGGDQYVGRYRVLDPDVWSLIWCVRGPRKHYDMRTLYRRAAGSSAARAGFPFTFAQAADGGLDGPPVASLK
jgi:hypothetical protein